MSKYDVARPGGTCSKTGRTIEEGEEFYAVLFEDGGTLRREDYAEDAWDGPPEGAFVVFKSRLPRKEEKKKRLLVDDDILVDFFERLESETEPSRQHFRFVIALILMRKRILRYEETKHDEEGREFWQMRLTKRQTVHAVLNPRLDDDQIQNVTAQLGAILSEGTQGLAEEEARTEE